MNIKEIRLSNGISIKDFAKSINIPERTYIRYENDENYGNKITRKAIEQIINDKFGVSEEKGILKLDIIKQKIQEVLGNKQNVELCILYGSYAKGYAKEDSDIDLCIDTNLKGLEFVGLAEQLHLALNKKIDLIRVYDLIDNYELLKEILKDGIKIYEQH